MFRKKNFDGVIEAVRYAPDGQISWVRAYERSGFVFSDWLMLDRVSLLERLKEGQRFHLGQRKPYLGNDFELAEAVQLVGEEGSEKIISGDTQGNQDHLAGIPLF